MKKKGRGRGYKKALLKNLKKNLTTYKRITTTKAKAKKLKSIFLKEKGGVVRTTRLQRRRGDNAPQILLEWEKKNENKNLQNKRNKKEMAVS